MNFADPIAHNRSRSNEVDYGDPRSMKKDHDPQDEYKATLIIGEHEPVLRELFMCFFLHGWDILFSSIQSHREIMEEACSLRSLQVIKS